MQIALDEFHSKVRDLLATPNLPKSEDRYSAFGTSDPYPSIAPALLHAGHIASYAVAAGMIDPFEVEALEKPATYLVSLEGPVRYLDSNGRVQSFYLSSAVSIPNEADVRREFILEPNSLCYVTLKPTFRMPSYLAGRFNLLIRDVYRGLLVGTGPLVDPGFVGRLSIPVHNFTSRSYRLRADEGFVYFEFTKLGGKRGKSSTQKPGWLNPSIDDHPPFPSSKKKRKTLDDYIDQATNSGPAQNALPGELKRIRETADRAASRLGWFTLGGFVGAIVLGITTYAAVMTAFQIYLGAQQFVQSSREEVVSSVGKIEIENSQLRTEVTLLKRQLEELKVRLDGGKESGAPIALPESK